jgi:hypothetical protein
MRKTRFWAAIAAGALILAGIAGWVYPSHRPLEAMASTSIEAKVDPFSLMSTAKDLPAEEFEDFSLVFSSPAPKPIDP